ncbi:RING-type E3 ubiquitin transferase, partial [Quillaja saponaria]
HIQNPITKLQAFPFLSVSLSMIQKLKGSGRRILTFPAVHPCLKISPSTLLSSILNLSHSICNFKSKFFASNKRNAREAIRLVGVLQIFLEEIRDEQSNLLDSVVIAFCELHLVFQKLQFLLEDCTREGAQVWMLMESENVANQFRVSARSIATALDILPLDSIEVSMELKEHFELVMRQSRKARFEVDPDDKRAAMDVVSTLKQFENGIFPSDIDLKRVLDHIGIRTWSECNKEVKFLDSEIGLECLNEEKIKVAWLSSLMGFMNYCRCVVFDVVKGEGDQQSDGRGSSRDSEVLASLNPYDFRCPISLELMSEPVTILSGHTYDRSSILKWFKGGNVNCPKTGQRLNNTKWVPNLVLQRLIQQYCSEKGISIADQGRRNRDATRTVHPGSLAAKEAMKMLASFLAYRLETGVGEERNGAAYEFRLLSKANIFNRSCLVEAGCIQHLLKLLSSKDSSTQENAIASLLNISKHSKSITVIVENRGLELIVDVLKKGMKVEARQHAAATLFYLASIEEYRRLIGETTEAIPALIELIKDGTDRAKKNALVAMFGLLMEP